MSQALKATGEESSGISSIANGTQSLTLPILRELLLEETRYQGDLGEIPCSAPLR